MDLNNKILGSREIFFSPSFLGKGIVILAGIYEASLNPETVPLIQS